MPRILTTRASAIILSAANYNGLFCKSFTRKLHMADKVISTADNTATDETFSFGSQCGQCPLSRIPEKVWLEFLRPPFRRRHPILYWLFWIALVLFLAGLMHAWSSKDDVFGSEGLALISVRGPIMDVAPVLAWIRDVENNPNVRGALLRVDSPGGGAAASQELYDALARLSAKMPLAVSMGATAASGGLMIAMAGQRVFANPSTVTGSIGVRMDIPQLQELMRKIGVGQETLVSAPFKDAASYTHALTPADRAYLQGVIDDMHAQFVDIVARGRHMPREKAAELANGKICTGSQAVGLGLVDELGGQEAAHAWLSARTGVPVKKPLLSRRKSRRSLLESLEKLAALADLVPLGEKSGPAFLYQ